MALSSISKTGKPNRVELWAKLTILGVIIYIVIDVVLSFLRPDYSWLHNAESDYGRGPYFWLMDINFLLRCFLSLALVKAILIRFPASKFVKQASILMVVWAIASGLLAFFADNPYGYSRLASGSVHLILAFIAFIAAVFAMITFNKLAILPRATRNYTYFLTIVAAIFLVLLGHASFRPHGLGGLYERLFLASVLAWEVVLALFTQSDAKELNNKQSSATS